MYSTLLVGTADRLFVHDRTSETVHKGHSITALAFDGRTWWVVLNRREIQRSHNLKDWERVAKSRNLEISCLAAVDSGVWAGSYGAHFFHLNGELIQNAAFDQAEGRESWFTPWGGPPETRSIATSNTGILYVNVHVGGILRSLDSGTTWHPTIQVRSDVHEVVVHPGEPEFIMAACGWGLGISRNAGDSWDFLTEGLHGLYCRAVALSGNLIYITASTGSSSHQGAVYRADLNEFDHFERCRNGLLEWTPSNIDTFCLAASGSFVAFGTDQGSVYISEDFGVNWRLLAFGLPPVRCVKFT